MLRQAISKHTGEKEREWPKDIPTADYGEVNMTNSLPLLDAVPHLFPGEGIATDSPKNMEEYNQGWDDLFCRHTSQVPDLTPYKSLSCML